LVKAVLSNKWTVRTDRFIEMWVDAISLKRSGWEGFEKDPFDKGSFSTLVSRVSVLHLEMKTPRTLWRLLLEWVFPSPAHFRLKLSFIK